MFDTGTYKLFKPILIDDKEVKELNYDFVNLPSDSIKKATQGLQQEGYTVLLPQNDVQLHSILLGCAAGLDYQDVRRLHDKDKMGMATISMGFFNDVSVE